MVFGSPRHALLVLLFPKSYFSRRLQGEPAPKMTSVGVDVARYRRLHAQVSCYPIQV